jgi:hypothetical protein
VHYLLTHLLAIASVILLPVRVAFCLRLLRSMFRRAPRRPGPIRRATGLAQHNAAKAIVDRALKLLEIVELTVPRTWW